MKAPKTKQEATEIIMPYRKADNDPHQTNKNPDMITREAYEMLKGLLRYKDIDISDRENTIKELEGRLAKYESEPKVQCVIRIMAPQNPTS